jgi:hypothetical protein
MSRMLAVGLVLTGLLAGCAGSGERAGGGARNVITAEEIRQLSVANAMEVVERLRPHFLQRRGPATFENPASTAVIYVDGVRRGGTGELRQIPASHAVSIEYISPADATTRWGTGHVAGVIHVRTRL